MIMMDLVMPEMDGFEATVQLRNTPELKDIAVVAVSAGVSGEMRDASMSVGCNDYMVKPVEVNELMEVLQTHLELEWLFEDEDSPEPGADQQLISLKDAKAQRY